jgi:hypothetical protein
LGYSFNRIKHIKQALNLIFAKTNKQKMTVDQSIETQKEFSTPENSILLRSFIVGFIASMLTVSILVFAVKKIGNNMSTPVTTAYTPSK